MKTDYKKIIITRLKKSGRKPISFRQLLKYCRKKNFDFGSFVNAVEQLKAEGVITENKMGLALSDKKSLAKCVVLRLNKTYGFVQDCDTGEEIFIVGKYLKGAMPGDKVLIRTFKGTGNSLEGEVIDIIEENFIRFTGQLVYDAFDLKLVPDTLTKYSMDFENPFGLELHEGDKVMAEITERGERHSQHKCRIISNFGSSMKASACAMSVLEVNNISPLFPPEVIFEVKQVCDYSMIQAEIPNRLDLRGETIFTIDGADTKDIDDAISVKKTANGYHLGVHIADVSHYVRPRSKLDNEAFERGTSVYFADKVVPMLPRDLSNGICSLNPNEDRLAFSALIDLDKNGKIVDYKFVKTVICSRVKGVYSEINQILEGDVTDALLEKYSQVIDMLPVLNELADILYHNRIQRGAPQIESTESKLVINDDDVCVDVFPRTRGRSEEMIEDLMLTANECAARFGIEHELPFVYRIHEKPSYEKIEALKSDLVKLDIPFNSNGQVTPKDMSEILEKANKTSKAMIVNNIVLRSMSKAKYSTEPVGHFGLVLDDYAHFTSPIRRYPDLTIHRIMSAYLEGATAAECNTIFNKFVYASAEQSTNTELVAMNVERSCEDCYKAEYMSSHIGEEFDGVISSVTDFGMFVLLPNTCEGLLHIDDMPAGEYFYDGAMSLKNMNTGKEYNVGDSIEVKIKDANVNSGKIDFDIA